MAERTEKSCQETTNQWEKISFSALSEINSLCAGKKVDDLIYTARLASYRFVLSLSHLGPDLDLDYAAQGNGRLSWLYDKLLSSYREMNNGKTLENAENANSELDRVATLTFIAWRFLESYYLIKNFPPKPPEQQTTIATIKEILCCTHNLIEEYQAQLPFDFTAVQDDLLDLARGRIRLAINDLNFDLQIPYFRSQKRSK